MGYTMILYPTTVIFQVAKTTSNALDALKNGKALPTTQAVSMDQFMEIVDLPYWKKIEEKFEGKQL